MADREIGRRAFDWSYVRVGALFAFGLVALVFGVYQVGRVFDVFADRYTILTEVPTVAGLREGAPVTLAGQRVGQVAAIEFIPIEQKRDTNNLRVHLSVNRGVAPQIRQDSRAHIRTQGLLGDKFVDIDPGTQAARPLAAGELLPAAATVDIDMLFGRLARTLDTAQVLVSDLGAVTGALARGEGSLGRLLVDDALYQRATAATVELSNLLGEINRGQGTLARLTRDPVLYERVSTAVARLDTLGISALHGEGTLGQLLRSDTLHVSFMASAAHADTALAALAEVLRGVRDGEGTIGRLATDQGLYDEILKAVLDIQTFIQAIRADPRQIRPQITVDVF